MQFDARTAKLLKPGSHLTIDGCPGLRLKATDNSRTWIYRYKSPIDGRMRQTKIGQWPAVSPASAIAQWEQLRDVRDAGRDPAVEKRTARDETRAAVERDRESKRSALTVRMLCEGYLTGHVERNRKEKGATEVRRMFDTMLGEFGNLPAAAVTRAQAFDLLESYNDIPVQGAKLRTELGAAWDYALDAGRLPESTPNWWRQIMRGRLRSTGKKIEGQSVGTAKRVLSESEVGELVRWLPNFSRTVEDALTLYLWTGTRGSEIVAMKAGEISEEADGLWWTIPKAKTKNARHQNATDLRVPLIGRAAAIVRRRLPHAKEGYLFHSRSPSGFVEQKAVQTAVHYHQPYSKTRPDAERPRLTVTHWAPHDLRRTARTLLASMGCPGEVAEAVLGHMQPGIKGVYNRHAYDQERREWLTRLDARLEQLAAKH
jgi:integrase